MSDTTRTKQLIKNVLIDLCQTQSFRKISVKKSQTKQKSIDKHFIIILQINTICFVGSIVRMHCII